MIRDAALGDGDEPGGKRPAIAVERRSGAPGGDEHGLRYVSGILGTTHTPQSHGIDEGTPLLIGLLQRRLVASGEATTDLGRGCGCWSMHPIVCHAPGDRAGIPVARAWRNADRTKRGLRVTFASHIRSGRADYCRVAGSKPGAAEPCRSSGSLRWKPGRRRW